MGTPTPRTPTKAMAVLPAWLERVGGVLVQNGQGKFGAVGASDLGLVLVLLFVFATAVNPFGEAAAGWWATKSASGAMLIASTMGRSVLLPVGVWFVGEFIVGSARAQVAGLLVVPVLLYALLDRMAEAMGLFLPSWSVPALASGHALVLAVLARRGSKQAHEATRPTRARLSRLVGGALVLGALGFGARDGVGVVSRFDELGPLRPSSEAPPFAIVRDDGVSFDHASLRGKVTAMAFFTTWCPACVAELSMLEDFHQRHASRGLQVVGVHLDQGESAGEMRVKLDSYRRARGLTFPLGFDDGHAARALRVGPVVPHTLIFDREGVVRYVHQGQVTRAGLRDELEGLLAK